MLSGFRSSSLVFYQLDRALISKISYAFVRSLCLAPPLLFRETSVTASQLRILLSLCRFSKLTSKEQKKKKKVFSFNALEVFRGSLLLLGRKEKRRRIWVWVVCLGGAILRNGYVLQGW